MKKRYGLFSMRQILCWVESNDHHRLSTRTRKLLFKKIKHKYEYNPFIFISIVDTKLGKSDIPKDPLLKKNATIHFTNILRN